MNLWALVSPFLKILSLHIVSKKFLEFLQFQEHLLLGRLQEALVVGAPGRREKSDRLVDGWATSAKEASTAAFSLCYLEQRNLEQEGCES